MRSGIKRHFGPKPITARAPENRIASICCCPCQQYGVSVSGHVAVHEAHEGELSYADAAVRLPLYLPLIAVTGTVRPPISPSGL